MTDIKIYKTQDLVLKVGLNYDPSKLDLGAWTVFIDVLCGDRTYQKEAITNALVYLASGKYANIESLVDENWRDNSELHERYTDVSEYKKKLQFSGQLSGVIDLATGTGKSYVMYGVAQIALGIGLVDRVLVLCPSLTIESGLKEKFENLSGDNKLKSALPSSVVIGSPRIVDANQTIKRGDIAVENIHAVYERTGSSIQDSLKDRGSNTLVLNDEVHHAYNSSNDRDIRKWKSFLLEPDYGFRYILGFTGTAYTGDEYFNDVIYRYSIRRAVDDKVVKSVDYVAKDDSLNKDEKFQKILDNHKEFVRKYRLVKPITIMVTKDIAGARKLQSDLVDFLQKYLKLDPSAVQSKVLVVTSHKDHKKNLISLKSVDDKENAVEWIISVSMLTEGWDVKNVFQIVPWEDRAFNSKLLIAQVLGRGMRVPAQYSIPPPKVRVFNHDAWSRSIRGLVDEVLETEMKVVSHPLTTGDRAKHHFELHAISYEKEEKSVTAKEDTKVFDYTKNLINLVSQAEQINRETDYEDLKGVIRPKRTVIRKRVLTVDEVVNKVLETFNTRDFEAKIRFPKGTYDKENLPPRDEIKDIVLKSMKKVGINSGVLTEDNALRVYQSFQTFFRKRGSTVAFTRKAQKPQVISTKSLERESLSVGNLRRGATAFYTEKFPIENSKEQKDVLDEVINDESLPRSASKEINSYCFKTPVNLVLTKYEPERKFIETITQAEVAKKIGAWVKSRDQHFYSIEYSWRKGEHVTQSYFNPDFFLKLGADIVVVEIKADNDDSDENKAKYRWAKKHFEILNQSLKVNKIRQKYHFHFLSPMSYAEFTQYLQDGRLVNDEFRSALDNKLMVSE